MARKLLQIVALVLALTVPLSAQVQPQQEPVQTFETSISVGYVLLSFVATDAKGRTLRHVNPKDVTVLVDGRPVATDMFDRSNDAPVSFTILLDGSGSMGLAGKKEAARAAIAKLLDLRRTGDDFGLFVFSRGAVREVVPFTDNPYEILKGVDSVKPWGKTAFFDAVAEMPDRSLLGNNGVRAIILLTDGLDNASTMTKTELARTLEGVNVPIYPLGLRLQPLSKADEGANPETLTDIQILAYIAALSGGQVAVGDDAEQLGKAIDSVAQDLRSQYIVGFTPTGKGEVRYRRVVIKVKGGGKVIRTRGGYKGTEPPLLASKTTRAKPAAAAKTVAPQPQPKSSKPKRSPVSIP